MRSMLLGVAETGLELTPKAAEGLFSMKFLLLQALRLASQATSLYTREAHYRPTVHLKGVTHYNTLQGKACEKEYEQMPVLLLFFRQVKPALWKAPLVLPFFVDLGKFLLFIEIFAHIKVFAHR